MLARMMQVLQTQKLLLRRATVCPCTSPHRTYAFNANATGRQLMPLRYFSTSKSHDKSLVTSSAYFRSISRDIEALENLFQLMASDTNVANNFEQCVTSLLKCHEKEKRVFVTGIGKSGVVAKRLASTLSSISIRSQCIYGGEWVHGELGGLKHGDVIIIISHSGRTAELLPLPDMFRKAGCSVMAVVGDGCSPLSRCCDLFMIAPAEDEAGCPVPSRSIIVQEAICNAIVQQLIANMVDGARHLKSSHPGGAIGARFAT
ncbi:unnamed protein product [Peronospora belbahrii]|uniref:SIS domain-containing protein n=1 Tax=Peronospora belbahrii TaxID=622444 RepID=A0AAU9L7E8_9STRA|nr:unnamed protein product [Peronospora belbahrii]